jgi:hypothetical protein
VHPLLETSDKGLLGDRLRLLTDETAAEGVVKAAACPEQATYITFNKLIDRMKLTKLLTRLDILFHGDQIIEECIPSLLVLRSSDRQVHRWTWCHFLLFVSRR